MKKMSLWQIAQAAVLIRTSPLPGSASSTVSIVSGAPKARQMAALVFIGVVPGDSLVKPRGPFRAALPRSSAVLVRGASIFSGPREETAGNVSDGTVCVSLTLL